MAIGNDQGCPLVDAGAKSAIISCVEAINARLGRSSWVLMVLVGSVPSSKPADSVAAVCTRLHAQLGVNCAFVCPPALCIDTQAAIQRISAKVATGRISPSSTHSADRKPRMRVFAATGSGEVGIDGCLDPAAVLVRNKEVLASLAGVLCFGKSPLAAATVSALVTDAGLPLHVCEGVLVMSRAGGGREVGTWAGKASAAGAETATVRSIVAAASPPATDAASAHRPRKGRGKSSIGPCSSFSAGTGLAASRRDAAKGVYPCLPLCDAVLLGTAHGGTPARAVPGGAITAAVEDGWVMTMQQPWASMVIQGLKRAEGRVWGVDFTGWLWIHAAGRPPSAADIGAVEEMYRDVYAVGVTANAQGALSGPAPGADGAVTSGALPSALRMPPTYPTACLLGCVFVAGMASQDEFQRLRGCVPASVLAESVSPFVFLCERPRRLAAPVQMKGQHKLWRLSPRSAAAGLAEGLIPVRGPQPVVFPVKRTTPKEATT